MASLAPARSQTVITATFVVVHRVGTFLEFLDQALFQQPPDGAVEGARAEPDLPAGTSADVLQDGVPMAVPVGQRDQDLERIFAKSHAGHYSRFRYSWKWNTKVGRRLVTDVRSPPPP